MTAAPGRPLHTLRTTCRACGGGDLVRFLSLGPTPLANAFRRTPADFASERSFPLDVYFCERCSLVQLLDVIDPAVLFGEYIYVTGTSRTMAVHNAGYARAVLDRLALVPKDLVVEVASNDGSLLRCFRDAGVRTLGIEPAANIAETARAAGIETLARFFDAEAGEAVRESHGAARAVIGNNVLAHVDDTVGFLSGCRDLLAPGGRVFVEVPYLAELLARLEYDTIYHEHLCYFSVTALLRLFQQAGLAVTAVDPVPVHGGSLRVEAGLRSEQDGHAPAVLALAEAEREAGLANVERYRRFAADVERHREALLSLLRRLAEGGATLGGYGAPAKGNTLLNYCGIDDTLLPFTVDRNPLKVGRWTPGMHIPVLPVEAVLERRPDYLLILAWNFADEIMSQQREYGRRGGRFVLPLPEPVVV